jgi:sugar (pentulose or hexulose) kinase
MADRVFLGIDVGTGGVRCALCTIDGQCTASARVAFDNAEVHGLGPGRHEQQPEAWWQALAKCIRSTTESVDPATIAALSVDSTSGTVLFLDGGGRPLRPAIMYNDARAGDQAATINEAATDFISRHGFRFGSSFALAKVMWVAEKEPAIFDGARTICHAADYLAGRIRGDYSFTDTSNALKMGCDLYDCSWPEFIRATLAIPVEKLPRPVAPGQLTGSVCRAAADALGLATRTKVVAGCTDGTAGFLASGASAAGDWSSTLGTTLVLRGISNQIIKDPAGRMYCHRHPDGFWLPGAACSVGGECLTAHFPAADLAELDLRAGRLGHTDLVCYPLARRGERFPFVNTDAEELLSRPPADDVELHLACLEGVAFVERWGMEVLAQLGADTSGAAYATGGGAKSDLWLRIRATVLDRTLAVPERTGSEFGAAALAAAPSCESVSHACRRIVRINRTIEPDPGRTAYYEEKYARFRKLCAAHGYG